MTSTANRTGPGPSSASGDGDRFPEPHTIVIGAGSGGLTVAVGLSGFGKRVRLIERALVGGDCTNVGCIPSKALLHATAVPAGRSGAEMLAHVRGRRDKLREEETEMFGSLDKLDLQFGRAKIVAPGVVEVTESDGSVDRIEAKHIVVATGSRPRRLAIDGLPDDRCLTNEELFEQTAAPARLVIVGAGPVGLEMATAFRRMGTEVVVLEAADQILPAVLPAAAEILSRTLQRAEIDLRPGMVAKDFDPATSTLNIVPIDGGATDAILDVDKVLMAVGRIPNTEDLGLETLGVELVAGRILVDGKGRSTIDNIWATGDASTEGGTTHAANAWGRRIIKAIVAPMAPLGAKPEQPAVTFTDPEVAMIGVQPVEVPFDVRRVIFDLSKADRAFTDDVEDGIIVVDVRRFSGKILGATIVGPRSGELISLFALAMKNDVKFQKWYGVVWPYPVYADALGRVVDQFMLEHLKNLHKDLPRWVVGRIRRT